MNVHSVVVFSLHYIYDIVSSHYNMLEQINYQLTYKWNLGLQVNGITERNLSDKVTTTRKDQARYGSNNRIARGHA